MRIKARSEGTDRMFLSVHTCEELKQQLPFIETRDTLRVFLFTRKIF